MNSQLSGLFKRAENLKVKLIQNDKFPYIYDLELDSPNKLFGFDSFELHVVLYPYSRKISSKSFVISPFEEYMHDAVGSYRSVYEKIEQIANNIFGISLGLLIACIFLWLKPSDLFSVQSIISVAGSYFIGKDIWDDIERFLVNATKDWKLKYQLSYYFYRLAKNTTLSLYSKLARQRRYGIKSLSPSEIDFVESSNSQTVRMLFRREDFVSHKENSAHILSIRLDPNLLSEFAESGFMLGIKMSFNRRFAFFHLSQEIFQSLERESLGCLDSSGSWSENNIFFRNNIAFSNLKYQASSGLLKDSTLIEFQTSLSH